MGSRRRLASHCLRSSRISRRALVGGAAGLVIAGAGGCGGTKSAAPPATTATAQPAPTTILTPTPTQDTIASPVAGYLDPTKWKGRTLTIAVRGGDYQHAQERAFFDPFAAATGATIQTKSADGSRFKSQVESEQVTWDLLTFPTEDVPGLAHGNFLEPIDYTVVEATALLDRVALQYAVAAAFFSTVIIFAAGASKAPQDWADFWDVRPPPAGKDPEPAAARALQRTPIGTLEFALLADGVPADQLYPIDVERAFANLDRIRRNVLVWYEDGKQPVELLVSNQVGMASAWNVRPWQLGVADTVRVQWYGGMLTADSWVVPRGAPNRDVAMDFINFATRAVPSANFTRLVPYGPVNKDAFDLLRGDRSAILPSAPANRAVQFVQNWNWWADNMDALTKRFEDWLLTEPRAASPAAGAASSGESAAYLRVTGVPPTRTQHAAPQPPVQPTLAEQ